MGLPARPRVAAVLVAVALLWSGIATTSVAVAATTDADVAADATDGTAYAVANLTGGSDAINETTNTTENTTDDTVETVDDTTDSTGETVDDASENLTDATNTTVSTNTTDAVSETTDTVTNATESVTNVTVGESLDGSVETVTNATDDVLSPTESTVRATSTTTAQTTPTRTDTTSRDAACECATTASNATAPEAPAQSGTDGTPEGGLDPATVTTALGATLAAAGLSSPSVSASGSAVGSLFSSWWHRVLGAAGYSRYGDSDPLADDRRERIYDAVCASPGVSQSALADRTDVPLSSLRHHLDVLAHEDLVVDVRVEGHRRYFPAEMADPSGAVGADVGVAGASVLEEVSRLEPATGSELADALDRDPSTVSHHLERLEEAGLVERERSGRAIRNRLTPAAQRVLSECPFGANAATADD